MALLRFIEARQGSVIIDGTDISMLKVSHLRSRLHIIPQDPFLSSGTVLSNLDPQGQFLDSKLQEALDRFNVLSALDLVKCGSSGADEYASLSASMKEVRIYREASASFSASAAPFYLKSKLLILDEATSGIGKRSDAVIQSAIRQEATRCGTTLVVVAHWLSTIIDFGPVVELGPARSLMDMEKGVFRFMVKEFYYAERFNM
ncbi:ABC transporter C family member 8 [Talaromyces pinophilus]|nr:ABC transporter C family member 8 [Talaromyces pinophilus]